ncbi:MULTISPECIES: TonB-dependent receptor [unclassified Luteibacter]|uniref:TonB-dependent receptor n=1 Tax=unclassified Luteibacter TaxID=2620188 RepID=UPI0008C847B5|nr:MULTISPECIES: TonB-dependent receptor [unclassified Luteibacter]MDR6937455.1 TonB-dependent receptor [Luteibacter sp. 3190]SEW24428.1 TonB-dependent receptor [Luteibacter sp. 329MFSha]
MTYQHMLKRKPLSAALAAATLSLVGYMGVPASAFAQTAAPATAAAVAPAQAQAPAGAATPQDEKDKEADKKKVGPTNLDTVVVTSYRQSVEQSVIEKRDANSIVEVINAQNIAQFPAKNIADALAHVPGVVISRESGEGKTVSIRGLAPELTYTQLNGNYVASADTSAGLTRSFNYTLFPANMFSDIKLYKSLEARLDEGGIGGNVDLRTRRPLEMGVNEGFVTGTAASSDTSAKTEPQGSALWSWKNKDETFGVLVAGAYQKRQATTYSADATSWHWWSDDCRDHTTCTQPPVNVHGKPYGAAVDNNIDLWGNGVVDQAGNISNGFWMPQQFATSRNDLNLKTKGAQATMQFKPSDHLLLTGNYFRFERTQKQITNTLEIPEWGLPNNTNFADQNGRLLAPNGLTFDKSGTIVTGANYVLPPAGVGCNSTVNPVTGATRQAVDVCNTEIPWLNGNYSIEKAKSQTVNIEGEWDTGGALSGSFNVGRTWASGGPSVELGMAAKPRNFVNGAWVNGSNGASWDLSGKPGISAAPDVLQNMLAGAGQVDLGSTGSNMVNTTNSQNFAQADFTWSLDSSWLQSIQFGGKYTDANAEQQSNEVRWYCKGTTLQFQTCDPNAGQLPPGFLLPNYLDGVNHAYGDDIFPAINFPAYYNHLNSTYDRVIYNKPQNKSSIGEKVAAAYVQANFDTGTIRGNVGVRFVTTKQDLTVANQVTTNNATYYHDAGGNILICPASGVNAGGGPCAPGDFQYLPREIAVVEGFTNSTTNKRYNKFLPSFNIAWTIADDFVLRAAGSQALARANYTDLAQLGQLTNNTQEYYNDRKQFGAPLPGWYGSGANADLKPFTATQFDLAGEWYYATHGVVGIDLFQKKVKNFVVPVTVNNIDVDVGGTPTNFRQYSTNANGRSGTSKGIEVYAQHTWDNGFGYIANYTLNHTNETAVALGDTQVGKAELIGSAKYAANVSLFYEKNGLLLRASDNWTGRRMNGLAAGLPIYSQPYHQIDLNGDYEFNKHFMVTASIINFNKGTPHTYLGGDTRARLVNLLYPGRQYYVGVTYKFGGESDK